MADKLTAKAATVVATVVKVSESNRFLLKVFTKMGKGPRFSSKSHWSFERRIFEGVANAGQSGASPLLCGCQSLFVSIARVLQL